jgi:hypothetical protein
MILAFELMHGLRLLTIANYISAYLRNTAILVRLRKLTGQKLVEMLIDYIKLDYTSTNVIARENAN